MTTISDVATYVFILVGFVSVGLVIVLSSFPESREFMLGYNRNKYHIINLNNMNPNVVFETGKSLCRKFDYEHCVGLTCMQGATIPSNGKELLDCLGKELQTSGCTEKFDVRDQIYVNSLICKSN